MKNIEQIKMIKSHLRRGDYAVIIERIQNNSGTTFARSTVAAALSPASPFSNELIYAVALKLALERKETTGQIAELERQLNE